MTKLFGTDGMRGVAGRFPLDYSTVCLLGETLVELLEGEGLPPKIIIGRDTRESGKWLEQALLQGMGSKKGEFVSVGVIPTSAVSYLTQKHHFSAGIVISASHNPFRDNGIKIFSSAGTKIPGSWEKRLEEGMQERQRSIEPRSIPIHPMPTLGQEYTEFLLSRLQGDMDIPGLKIVLDCANGASSAIAPFVFQRLGFDVVSIHSSPDGRNINHRCGALHPETLAGYVKEDKADLGIAYDGDADRAVWIDEKGQILNGDHTLYIQGRSMKEERRLKSGRIVATIMSNMGLEKALEEMDIGLIRTNVGDRFVLEEMIRSGANLGGEQSGHTIFLDDCPTGDGILTSIKMVEVLFKTGKPLSDLLRDYRVYPQVHRNVPVARKDDFSLYPEIIRTMEGIENQLDNRGRFNLRYSGTELLARIMMEGPDQKELEDLADRMADVLNRWLGVGS